MFENLQTNLRQFQCPHIIGRYSRWWWNIIKFKCSVQFPHARKSKEGLEKWTLWTCDMSLMLWYMILTVLFQSLETVRPWIQSAEGRWFLFSKEELSIRFTLSVDNPNIDHWLNIGNTDHFPHSSAMMLISLNILFQGHQRRKVAICRRKGQWLAKEKICQVQNLP